MNYLEVLYGDIMNQKLYEEVDLIYGSKGVGNYLIKLFQEKNEKI